MLKAIFGERVRAARTLRRLKSADVASQMGWTASRQTRLEQADEVEVDEEQLTQLSGVLAFPILYFSVRPTGTVSAEDLLFRAPLATTKKEKSYLAEYARFIGEILEWLDGQHRLPPVRIPALASGTPIQEAAAAVRRSLSVSPSEPIDHLTHRVERAGVPIIMRGTPGRLSLLRPEDEAFDVTNERHLGYSARVGEMKDRPITVLRANPSWERIRWTVAHEVGHVALHGRNLPKDSEDQASRFATELLAPIKVIRQELPVHITLAALTPMKLRWGVSLGALIIHLHENEIVSSERFETLRRQLYTRMNQSTGRTWGRDEPGWDARDVERPRLLATWLERCVGFTAPQAISQISGIWPSDLIASMLSGQRVKELGPSRRVPLSTRMPSDPVVSLHEWRRREA